MDYKNRANKLSLKETFAAYAIVSAKMAREIKNLQRISITHRIDKTVSLIVKVVLKDQTEIN